MKLASVTVWYNPDDSCVDNILSYNTFVKACYIVDNSSADNSFLAKQIPNAVYLPNFDNLGISKALNIGCSHALSDGFKFCMTMDQDSFWRESQLSKYLQLVDRNATGICVSFGPNLICPKNQCFLGMIKHLIFKKPSGLPNGEKEVEMLDCPRGVITSGNILKLSVWKEIGMFYEPFFIDEVDYEFCFRLKKYGYKIMKVACVKLNHNLGCPKFTFYPSGGGYRGKRLYYIFRNCLYIKRMYPDEYKKWNYSKWLGFNIRSNLFNFRWGQFFYIARALIDVKKNVMGKYEERRK